MAWQQLTVCCVRDKVDEVSAQCEAFGALSITYQDHGDEPLFPESLDDAPLWQEVEVLALFDADAVLPPVMSALDALSTRITKTIIEDQDWERACLDSFTPMAFGETVLVCPSWSEVPDTKADIVFIDPGLAFGTGTHETTGLCLKWLSEQSLDGLEVVDFGCGSGILGLAALKRGASRVWAVDNDPQAIQASQSNQALNADIAPQFEAMLPDALPEMEVDLVIANILANPLLSLAGELTALVRPEGTLLLSGILENQALMIREKYEKSFNFQEIICENGWLLCILKKR